MAQVDPIVSPKCPVLVEVAWLRLDLGNGLLEHLGIHESILDMWIRVELPGLRIKILGHGLDKIGHLED